MARFFLSDNIERENKYKSTLPDDIHIAYNASRYVGPRRLNSAQFFKENPDALQVSLSEWISEIYFGQNFELTPGFGSVINAALAAGTNISLGFDSGTGITTINSAATADNIYNIDGSLTGNRTVSIGSNLILWNGTGDFIWGDFTSAGNNSTILFSDNLGLYNLALKSGGIDQSSLSYLPTQMVQTVAGANGSISLNMIGASRLITATSQNLTRKIDFHIGSSLNSNPGGTPLTQGVIIQCDTSNQSYLEIDMATDVGKVSIFNQLNLPDYGSGTYTGTPTQLLAVDSLGNTIEEDPSLYLDNIYATDGTLSSSRFVDANNKRMQFNMLGKDAEFWIYDSTTYSSVPSSKIFFLHLPTFNGVTSGSMTALSNTFQPTSSGSNTTNNLKAFQNILTLSGGHIVTGGNAVGIENLVTLTGDEITTSYGFNQIIESFATTMTTVTGSRVKMDYNNSGGTLTNYRGLSVDMDISNGTVSNRYGVAVVAMDGAATTTDRAFFSVPDIPSELNGDFILTKYGSGTVTGTPTYFLAVDATGNIIETAGVGDNLGNHTMTQTLQTNGQRIAYDNSPGFLGMYVFPNGGIQVYPEIGQFPSDVEFPFAVRSTRASGIGSINKGISIFGDQLGDYDHNMLLNIIWTDSRIDPLSTPLSSAIHLNNKESTTGTFQAITFSSGGAYNHDASAIIASRLIDSVTDQVELFFGTSNAGGLSEQMTIDVDGNIFLHQYGSGNSGTAAYSLAVQADGQVITTAVGGGSDNLGDHIMTQNLQTSGFWLSNDGDNEGIFVDSDGKVGIGTDTPLEELNLHGTFRIDALTPSDNTWFSAHNSAGTLVGQMGEASTVGGGGLVFRGNRVGGGGAGVNFSSYIPSGGNAALEFRGHGGTSTTPTALSGTPLAKFMKYNGATYDDVVVIDVDGKVGIGTDSPANNLTVAADGTVNIEGLRASDDTSSSALLLTKSRGTLASPTSILSGDYMFNLSAGGYITGTGYVYNKGYIRVQTTENWSASANGTKLIFGVTAPTTTSTFEALSIDGDGTFTFDSTGSAPVNVSTSGTGTFSIGNYSFNSDQPVGAPEDNHVLTYNNITGQISLEASAGGADGNGIYDGNGTVPSSTIATLTDDFTFSMTGGASTVFDPASFTVLQSGGNVISFTANDFSVSGTSGQLLQSTDTSFSYTDSGTSNFTFVNTGLTASNTTSTSILGNSGIQYTSVGSTANLELNRSNAAVTALIDNDVIAKLEALGYHGSAYSPAAKIEFEVDGTVTDPTSMPGATVFYNTPSGSTTPAETARIAADGIISLGNYVFNTNQSVGAPQDNFVLTYDDGTGQISLEAAAGGGGGDGIYGGSGTVPTTVAATITDTLNFGSNLLYIDKTGNKVGINTSSPQTRLHVSDTGATPAAALLGSPHVLITKDAGRASLRLISASGTSSDSSRINFVRAKGTLASPTAVSNNDEILSIRGWGYDGTAAIPVARMAYVIDGFVGGPNDMPGRIEFWTTADGANAEQLRMTIRNNTTVGISDITPITSLHVTERNEFNNPRGILMQQNDSSASPAMYTFRKSRGNRFIPSAVQNGDQIGIIRASGYDGGAYFPRADIKFSVDGVVDNPTDAIPTNIILATGTTSSVDRFKISSAGIFTFDTTGSAPITVSTATGQFTIGNYTLNVDQTVGASQDSGALRYNDSSGEIEIDEPTSANLVPTGAYALHGVFPAKATKEGKLVTLSGWLIDGTINASNAFTFPAGYEPAQTMVTPVSIFGTDLQADDYVVHLYYDQISGNAQFWATPSSGSVDLSSHASAWISVDGVSYYTS